MTTAKGRLTLSSAAGQGQIDAFLRSVANIHAQGAASSVSYFV